MFFICGPLKLTPVHHYIMQCWVIQPWKSRQVTSMWISANQDGKKTQLTVKYSKSYVTCPYWETLILRPVGASNHLILSFLKFWRLLKFQLVTFYGFWYLFASTNGLFSSTHLARTFISSQKFISLLPWEFIKKNFLAQFVPIKKPLA